MLLQSHAGVIDLLPALPEAWPDGSFQGLVARGILLWMLQGLQGKLMHAQVLSRAGGFCKPYSLGRRLPNSIYSKAIALYIP